MNYVTISYRLIAAKGKKVCIYVCIYMYVYVSIHTYIYIYVYIRNRTRREQLIITTLEKILGTTLCK